MTFFSTGIVLMNPSLVFNSSDNFLVDTFWSKNRIDGSFGIDIAAWICFEEEETRKLEACKEAMWRGSSLRSLLFVNLYEGP